MSKDTTIRVDGKTAYFLFTGYGETRFVIKPDHSGLEITGRYFGRDGEAESSIAITVIDKHTVRIDTT